MCATLGIDASRALSAAPTGTEGYSYHLIRALLPRLLPRHRVRLYLRTSPSPEAFPGAELRVMPFPRLWTHLRLSWEMLRNPPRLLFVPAHVLPLWHPPRTLVTVHDLGYRYFPTAHPVGQRLYLALSTRWNARVATHVLADSEATRQALVDAYAIAPTKITVVYPGYDPTLRPIQDAVRRRAVCARYGIDGPYVLSLGRLQPRKNLIRLIRAFAEVCIDHPRLQLILAGPTGWLADPIYQEVARLGLQERVRFPGYIAEEDKAVLFSGAELFAFPSLYEGFGFPVLEAQACETPVLTSATSSLPEVAGDGALLVDPRQTAAIAEGLRRLLTDVELRRALIAQGRVNLQRFSWPRAAASVLAVIERLLA
ncbi:MAG: glycosyltransferase family 4 protein [Anaerolineae bacterium]